MSSQHFNTKSINFWKTKSIVGFMTPLDKQLDTLWSELVKLRAGGKCEYCRRPDTLNSHHIFSRSKRSTRWDERNGACLCAGHHTLSSTLSAHKTPIEFIEFLREKRGEEWYKILRLRAMTLAAGLDKKLIKVYLKQEIKKYGN